MTTGTHAEVIEAVPGDALDSMGSFLGDRRRRIQVATVVRTVVNRPDRAARKPHIAWRS